MKVAIGVLLSTIYWLAALFLSVGFVIGDCEGAACLAAKHENYRNFWLVSLAVYLALAVGLWLATRRKDRE
jgi:hypothetical protein